MALMLDLPMRRRGGLHHLLLLGILACTRPNPAVCCVSAADCASIGVSDPLRSCAAGEVCSSDHTCAEPQCTHDSDCNGATPVCDTATQTCVGCLTGSDCSAAAPVCDTTSNTCVGCGSDTDCSSQVCDVDTGACVDQSVIIYAADNGSDSAVCSIDHPCSITAAIAAITPSLNVLKLEPGTFHQALTIPVGLHLTIAATGATIEPSNSDPGLSTQDSSNVRVIGLSIVANNTNQVALNCNNDNGSVTSTLTVENANVESNFAAVESGPCMLSITRSRLHVDAGGLYIFVASSGTTATIDRTEFSGASAMLLNGGNSMVVTNSTFSNPSNPADPAFINNGGLLQISFSTLYDTPIDCGSASPDCSGSGKGICFDNSIIFTDTPGAPADTMTGTACSSKDTLVFPQSTGITGTGNLLGENPLLVDPASGDFHLQATSPAVDAADPAATDDHDFDGTKRPQGPRDDLGAFELTQP
jgi:hypothetical protein|nr:choice-of-anchor Q domain-containing protein [Kofleriaceae bacterium]